MLGVRLPQWMYLERDDHIWGVVWGISFVVMVGVEVARGYER